MIQEFNVRFVDKSFNDIYSAQLILNIENKMIIINVTEKQVVPNVNSAIRFPSLQFEIKTKELIPKEIPDDEIVKQLNISKNKEILNESEMAILDRIVQAMQNNIPLSKDEKSGLNSITYKLVGSKKRK